MLVYLDWNVFNLIEKRESLPPEEAEHYKRLYAAIGSGKIITPYSNAHLNDLLRGYRKNPVYLDGHLAIIEELTKNLCLCQYWKQAKPLWHIRPVRDFFEAAEEDPGLVWESFDELLDEEYAVTDSFTVNPLQIMRPLLSLKPVPPEFKQIYQADPIFHIIYPRTKAEMNEYALCCDLYHFSLMINRDFSLYRSLRKFLIQTLNKQRQNVQLIKTANKIIPEHPKFLDIDALFEQVKMDNVTGVASTYDKFFETFFRFDWKGYKADNQFPNMVDDALHSYYAAHCPYFITNDDRCQYKAEKTFERLKITTTVFTVKRFDAAFFNGH